MTRQHLEGQTMMQPLEAHMSTQHFEAQLGAGVATFHFYFFCQHNKGPVAADKGPAAAPANKWLAAAAPANNPDAAAWARVQGSMQQRGKGRCSERGEEEEAGMQQDRGEEDGVGKEGAAAGKATVL
jgi:hypothetical protein